jgi:hypothetical protein
VEPRKQPADESSRQSLTSFANEKLGPNGPRFHVDGKAIQLLGRSEYLCAAILSIGKSNRSKQKS